MSRRNPSATTLNLDFLQKLQTYELPRTYHLQADPGNGCAGDPPGYPTYYTRSIYTQHGNSTPYRPGRPDMVITYGGKDYVVRTHGMDDAAYEKRLRKLWKPLPLDHPRTRAWIVSTYQHFNHCYQDVERPEHGRPGTLIFPVPAYKLKTARTIQIAAKATDAEREAAVRAQEAEDTAADEFNAAERLRAERIATPDNHKAVIIIREFYPDYQPELDLIANPNSVENTGNWWESMDERPTPETCPGQYGHRHPVNGNWCQMCGWKAPEEETKS